jgi:hypothetical protein
LAQTGATERIKKKRKWQGSSIPDTRALGREGSSPAQRGAFYRALAKTQLVSPSHQFITFGRSPPLGGFRRLRGAIFHCGGWARLRVGLRPKLLRRRTTPCRGRAPSSFSDSDPQRLPAAHSSNRLPKEAARPSAQSSSTAGLPMGFPRGASSNP